MTAERLSVRHAARLEVLADIRAMYERDRVDLDDEVHRALADGIPIALVARAAGMSRQHVYDMRREWADQ